MDNCIVTISTATDAVSYPDGMPATFNGLVNVILSKRGTLLEGLYYCCVD